MKLSIQADVRFWRLADRIISRKGAVFERGRLDMPGNFADGEEASGRLGSSNAKRATVSASFVTAFSNHPSHVSTIVAVE